MKVVLFGHSYVRNMGKLSESTLKVNSTETLEISNSAFPGGKFSHFLGES